MAGNQQYQTQYEKLEALKINLYQFMETVQNGFKRYDAQLHSLKEQGLPIEDYEKIMSEFQPQFQNIVYKNDEVVIRAVEFVSRQQNMLTQLLSR